MKIVRNKIYLLRNIVAIGIATMFFYACTSDKKKGRIINFKEVAQGEGREVTIKHTDSGRLTAILKSPILKDFTHLDFPYTEFPKGIELTIYDTKGGESKVFSDYAIHYKLTNLINLKGNVRVFTADSSELEAPQLYWNQSLKWAYTDKPYVIKAKNGSINKGDGFDANQKFTLFKSRTNKGEQILKD